MKLVTVDEMKAIEREANGSGLTYEQMMENAGNGLADLVEFVHSHMGNKSVLGLVGSGNNGGDTLVALASLAKKGWKATGYLVTEREAGDECVEQLKEAGGKLLPKQEDPQYTQLSAAIHASGVVLDGVLGTGVRLPLKQEIAGALGAAKAAADESDAHVVAVDCPSGVNCDTGEAAEEAIPAELTVCMAAVKVGEIQFPAFNLVGKLDVVTIGLPEDLPTWMDVKREVANEAMVRTLLPKRPADSHKGTYGTAMIIGGSVNYTGSVLMAGEAAYRVGTGLVTLAVPSPLHTVLAGQIPEATWILLPNEVGVIAAEAAAVVQKNIEKIDAMLLGPGLGLEETTQTFLERLLYAKKKHERPGIGFVPAAPDTPKQEEYHLPPLVIDADGLKLLARIQDWPSRLPDSTILTPHPGEMSILTGLKIGEIQSDRLGIAGKYACEWKKVVVLKGACTVIAAPDGRIVVVPEATSALAKAGTGDVLSGMLTGLRAQGMDSFNAAVAGVWIHAQAGLAAAEQWGSTVPVVAGDVAMAIGEVFARWGTGM